MYIPTAGLDGAFHLSEAVEVPPLKNAPKK